MLAINDSNFEEMVINSQIPVLLDFWAPWCGPCRMISPIVEELSKEYEGKWRVHRHPHEVRHPQHPYSAVLQGRCNEREDGRLHNEGRHRRQNELNRVKHILL